MRSYWAIRVLKSFYPVSPVLTSSLHSSSLNFWFLLPHYRPALSYDIQVLYATVKILFAIPLITFLYFQPPRTYSQSLNYKNLLYFSYLNWGAILELLAYLFYPTCLPPQVDSEFLKIMQHNAVHIVGAQ